MGSPKPRPPDRREQRLTRRQSAAPPALVTTSLAKLEEQVGGREALVAALAHAPRTRDLDYVLGLLGDPRQLALPIAQVCAQGGITVGELIDAYKSGIVARAQAVSMPFVAEGLPKVVADTFKRAAPYQDTCYGCKGLGHVTEDPTDEEPNPAPSPCPLCAGTGVLTYQGDLEHKKLALEIGQVLKKGGGVSVQVDNRQAHVHLGTAGGALEQLQAATDRVLYGGGAAGPVMEGELTEDDGGEPRPDPEPPEPPEPPDPETP